LVAKGVCEQKVVGEQEQQLVRLYRRLDCATQICLPLIFIIFLMYYVMDVVYGDESSCFTSIANK
uniref:Bestrophin homolog n=1 Tax=Gongylonema pulchrum TaxID=637853 RepID=A0A183ELJ6_9BILA